MKLSFPALNTVNLLEFFSFALRLVVTVNAVVWRVIREELLTN